MDLLEREGPLAALLAACGEAARGRGGVVLVTGEPGIGKTALVTAFTARLRTGRVLRGFCDDLATPRPFGPLRDFGLAGDATPAELHDRLLDELRGPPSPAVLVLEDVHWADEATIDVIKTVGRRIEALPAVLVLTLREGELAAHHPLRTALAALPPGAVTRLPLEPLSPAAVAALVGDGAERVHALTGGNPFYVTELLAGRPADLPASVRDAVQGRVAGLPDAARQLLELVSVVPARVPIGVLDRLLPGWPAAAEEPERRRLLEVDRGAVRFRHELARTAVESGLPVSSRRRLHAQVLAVLQQTGADPADLVHHAEAAGDAEALAAAALPAARRATSAGANREAYAHYARAELFADRLPPGERARLLEELASAAYLIGRIPEALTAIGSATAGYRAAGDARAVGRCTRARSRLLWYAGEGDAARAEAAAAVGIFEPLGESAELARACSELSQLAMLACRSDEALHWGRRAAEMAQRVGDAPTHAHALVNIGTTEMHEDPDAAATLRAAHRAADACADRHEAVRALVNEAWTALRWVRPAAARGAAERARAYAEAHEVDSLGSYITMTLAWLRLRDGDWSAASVAEERLTGERTVNDLLARTVLAERAVRLGMPDAADRLAELAPLADATHELQRIEPVLELQIEAALTQGGPMPIGGIERAAALVADPGSPRPGGGRLAGWARVAGIDTGIRNLAAVPHAAMRAGDWAAAADAFGAVGWMYDRALFLSLLDDAAALREALETARRLGAAPLVGRVTRRLRELGLVIPHGRRESTRGNPAGLTERQVEVLRLVGEGLTTVEIADRLALSPRTVEHHVEAVLAKLGAENRRSAARLAADLGVLSS